MEAEKRAPTPPGTAASCAFRPATCGRLFAARPSGVSGRQSRRLTCPLPALDPAAPNKSDGQAFLLAARQRLLYVALREAQEWLAVGLLVAARNDAVDAHRVGVGRGLGLLDQHAEDPAFVDIQRRPGPG